MNKTHILVVNINNLVYTRNCVNDLLRQDTSFDLTLVDQGSNEPGTHEYYMQLSKDWSRKECELKIIKNNENVDLNRVWNKFYEDNNNEYLCFLNNDVRVPHNFVSDGEKIFEKEPSVGCVAHSTNHPKYKNVTSLNYVFVTDVKQGWDFTFRKIAYTKIPNELKVYCGDDFLFQKLYDNNWKCAFALSSPMTHIQGQSMKYLKEPPSDVKRYVNMGFPHNLKNCAQYSKIKPCK